MSLDVKKYKCLTCNTINTDRMKSKMGGIYFMRCDTCGKVTQHTEAKDGKEM